jgi:hypothetical protein
MYHLNSQRGLEPRVRFDPSNHEHRLDYATFLKYNGWKNGCRFLLEDPYADIPSMINAKIAEATLKSLMSIV